MRNLRTLFIIAFVILISCSNQTPEDNPVFEEKKATEVTINWNNQKQTIIGNGINFEGYHTSGGTEVLSSKFESMLATLPTELARISLPLKIWEPVNDNADPATFNLNNFQDTQGAHYTFLRMQELKKRGINSWLSIWDLENWNITDPTKTYARRIANFDEMAESIGTFLLQARDKYQVEPIYVSVNEPTIASENGWGGYQIALSPEEQILLISKAGAWFEKHGIKTKWLVALHKIYPSEIEQAKQIFANSDVKKYIAGFDFHGYGMHKSEFEAYMKSWEAWVKSTGLPTFCGECDYDNQFWLNSDRETWTIAAKNTGILLNRLFNMAGVSGVLPWYGNSADASRPYRFVAKHFMETFKSRTVVVESSSPNSEVLVTAGKRQGKYIIHLQNVSNLEIKVQIKDIPVQKFDCISTLPQSYYLTNNVLSVTNGQLSFVLPANSLHTLSGAID